MTSPPPAPRPPAPAARVLSRTVGVLLLAATLASGVLLLPATAATLMQPAGCAEGMDSSAPACDWFRWSAALALPWVGWLLGVFGALVPFVAAWRRRRREWLWPLAGAVGYALSLLLALIALFGLEEVLALPG